ncbi:hypothetical protein CsSME_00052926 [Camellia sinensis var. sinensis]
MDLIGPTRTESIGGKRYIFLTIDDYTRFSWVNFLREKSDAFDAFKSLVLKIQNEHGVSIRRIIRIQTDYGREFENSSFLDFCDMHGITHEFSAPITPQQNGDIEGKNAVVQKIAKVMLLSKKVHSNFWAEALNTAVYVVNHVYLRSDTLQTPYELWKGLKPNVKYFKTLGSKCYIFKDRVPLGKFDS